MPAIHYYLGRPARVWISAHSRRSPAGGLLARQRIAVARFGTDVAAAGGIGPALAAGLDPADYPVVPGGVPQAWERAQVYLGLCERYQQLYQAQVAELHLLIATVPGCSLPLSHPAPALVGLVRRSGALVRDAGDNEFAGLEAAFTGHGGQFVTQ